MIVSRAAYAVLAIAFLASCAREDVGPSLAPHMLSQAGTPLTDIPEWVRRAKGDKRLTCYLDVVEGASRTDAGWVTDGAAPLRLAGWAVDKAMQDAVQAPALVVLSNGDEMRVFKATRTERADVTVAAPFAQIAPKAAGVSADIAGSSLPSGRHEVSFVVGTEGRAVSCPLGPPNGILVR